MPHASFVHLRVHSAYSLSEGAIRLDELAKLCRKFAAPAVAVTDTNNLFGALEFSHAAHAAGVQPIIGCQLALAHDERGGARPGFGQGGKSGSASDPVVVLVQNAAGYRNLLKLIRIAHFGVTGGEAPVEPQLALSELARHGEGLIVLTGGPAGPVGRLLAAGQNPAAEEVLLRLAAAFPGRLYVELMRHGLAVEKATEPGFLDLAYRHNLPLVATNEAFFAERRMHEAHDALLCIAAGATMAAPERRRVSSEHYLKSPDEMRKLFADLPEAADNTLVVARRCAFMIEPVAPILPPFDCGNGLNETDGLKADAKAGLEQRLRASVWKPGMSEDEKEAVARPYRERLDYEIGVIVAMGYPGYFLVVADFIRWAKSQGIPVGPGRGSGAGSVVAWALTITDLDPLRFGLLFERFLNPERVSMPDFDIDFCQDRRDEVIHYVQDRYGRDQVAQIITFGKLQARAVLRDVGRVLEMPYGQVDKICKLVPHNPAAPVTLDKAIAEEPLLARAIEEDGAVGRLFAIARQLEGLYRHASIHAGGVVIGDRPLDELIPLYRDPKSERLVTGFNMKYIEEAGLIKFDFLGLKTLTVLADAAKLVEAGGGKKLDLANLPLDDEATVSMLARGETTGVFQLESAGMRDVLRNLKADTFEDIIAVVALYRPGPMGNIPSYIRRKHGQEKPDYLYPTLEGILKETFGIIIYQEQVMQIAQELAGFSLGHADLIRRAMGKKIKSEMNQQREAFVAGARNRNVPETRARDIFDLIAKFADYGFNKSHAATYALVAYQAAYLKAHHPVEFLAASMTHDMANPDKLNVFRQELERMGIRLLPPDVNASEARFSVGGETGGSGPAIRYALAAVRNVGTAAMESLVAGRRQKGPFRDLADFARRLDAKLANKRQIENLARAGAFDSLNPNRRQTVEGVEEILKHAHAAAAERGSSQISLFGGGGSENDAAPLVLPAVTDWPPMDRLGHEFDAIGFYLSAHPLDAYRRTLVRLGVRPIAEIIASPEPGPVRLAGTLIGKKERTSAKGNRYAFVQLSDMTGVFEAVVFAETLASARSLLEVGRSLLVRAAVQVEGETFRLTVQSLESLEEVAARTSAGVRIVVASQDALSPIKDIIAGKPGGNGEGRKGRIKIVSRLDTGQEVEFDLGDHRLQPGTLPALRNVSGVLEASEI
ncbi:MAG: DNA polymerase III subunit alpha [Rhodospirillales bacterium]|nr:DNA polymerase III subunit alpha [Rhodospirillales bacterium]